MNNDFEHDFLISVKASNEQDQLPNVEPSTRDEDSRKMKSSLVHGILISVIVMLVVMMIMMGVKLIQNNNELSYYKEMYENIEDGRPSEYEVDSDVDIEGINMMFSCVDKGEKQYAFYEDGTYYVIDLIEAMELESGTYETDWMTSIIVKSEDNNDRTIQLTGDEIMDGDLTYKCKKK